MTLLETSQIIFNLVISVAVILVATLVSIIAYEVIKFIKAVKKLSENIKRESSELYEKVNGFLENFSKLAFISRFFNKKEKKSK